MDSITFKNHLPAMAITNQTAQPTTAYNAGPKKISVLFSGNDQFTREPALKHNASLSTAGLKQTAIRYFNILCETAQNTYYNRSTIEAAILNDDIAKLDTLLFDKKQLNFLDQNGKAPIHHAIKYNRLEILVHLLLKQANPNLLTADGYSPMHLAIEDNNTQALIRLLAAGGNPNRLNARKESPLHDAVRLNRQSMAQQLLANPKTLINIQKNQSQNTPLHLSAATQNLTLLTALLNRGANTSLKNAQGETALQVLLNQRDDLDETLIHLLAPTQAHLNSSDNSGRTAVFTAAEQGKLTLLDKLLDRGADPTVPTKEGKTLLALALHESDNNRLLSRLISPQNTQAQLLKNNNINPIHMALKNGNEQAVELLLAAGYNPNERDTHQNTPLHHVAAKGNLHLLGRLLSMGADPTLKNEAGETALQLAVRNNEDIPELLLKSLAPTEEVMNSTDLNGFTVTHDATILGRKSLLSQLLSMGADPGLKTQKGLTPLHLSVKEGNNSILKLLLNQKGFNKSPVNDKLLSPIHLAASKKNAEALSLLLEAGSDPNLLDSRGCTALHYATLLDDPELIDALINDPRTFVNIQNKALSTPLHLSASKNNQKSMVHLLERGADPSLKNGADETALQILANQASDIHLDLMKRLAPTQQVLNSANGEGRTVLHDVTEQKKVKLLNKLLKLGADPNVKTDRGYTPIHLAAMQDDEDNRDSDQALLALAKAGGSLYEPITLSKRLENVDVRHLLCENGRMNLVEHLIRHSNQNQDQNFWDSTKRILKKYTKIQTAYEKEVLKTQEFQKQQEVKLRTELAIQDADEDKQKRLASYKNQLKEAQTAKLTSAIQAHRLENATPFNQALDIESEPNTMVNRYFNSISSND